MIPFPEYPRPQLVRDDWLNLNGPWQFAVTNGDEPDDYPDAIVVPYSPETLLSGLERTIGADEVLWYRRVVPRADLPPGPPGSRVLLHLGAVDQACLVSVNGREVARHIGGYLPIVADVTDAEGDLEIVVRVTDVTDRSWHTRGKQRTRRGGIWYTPQSGIWQSVWIETVPADGVRRVDYVPDLTGLQVTVTSDADVAAIEISAEGQVVAAGEVTCGVPTRFEIAEPRLWSPDDPFLYDVRIRCGAETVTSYAALRTVGVGPDDLDVPRLLLNGEPIFMAGVLDQGYWPDGLYTPPSDAALAADVIAAKELGFNMIRKHIKIEPLRWYHHCDRLGMLVWQDMPNGGTDYLLPVIALPAFLPLRLSDKRYRLFGRSSKQGRDEFLTELDAMIDHLRAVPSIVCWVPFNEGWGQFDASAVAERVRQNDPTRLVDHASGWHDQHGGDLRSLHVYFRRFKLPKRSDDRPVVLSEYGGYNLLVEGHAWGAKNFGYRRTGTAADLLERFRALHEDEIWPAIAEGLCASVYTQLTDVEDELNGLLTYDRTDKLDRAAVARVFNERPRPST